MNDSEIIELIKIIRDVVNKLNDIGMMYDKLRSISIDGKIIESMPDVDKPISVNLNNFKVYEFKNYSVECRDVVNAELRIRDRTIEIKVNGGLRYIDIINNGKIERGIVIQLSICPETIKSIIDGFRKIMNKLRENEKEIKEVIERMNKILSILKLALD